MRKLIAALAIALAAVTLTPVSATAATCVTQDEYNQVAYDMRKARVETIFDGYIGYLSHYSTGGGYEYDKRFYDACWTGADVVIMYARPLSGGGYWRVQWKDIQ